MDEVAEAQVRTNPNTDELYTATSWAAVDLEPVRNGEKKTAPPTYLKRNDGQALIYPGKPHVFYGESESLKSWCALLAVKSFLEAGLTALYVDFEADDETFYGNALMVGIPDGALGRSVRYIAPSVPLEYTQRSGDPRPNETALMDFALEVSSVRPSLVVFDGVTEAYAMHGWDINRAEDAARFQRVFGNLPDGAATIAIDHAGKDAGRGVIGSQHKRAGLNGAEYHFVPKVRAGRGGRSEAIIRVTKDRHGYVRAFTGPKGYIGRMIVSDTEIQIVAPDTYEAAYGADAPLFVAVLTYVEQHPGSTTTAIREGVKGTNTRITEVLEQLEAEGTVRHEDGANRAKHWYLVF